MKLLIEVLAGIGACAILAVMGMLTICFMAATPAKSLFPESNHRDQITHEAFPNEEQRLTANCGKSIAILNRVGEET